jgi:transposase-like protein
MEIYDKDFHPRRAYELALLGYTDRDMARSMNVSPGTIDKWKQWHEEFRDQLNRGKEVADIEVAQAFFKSCVGFTYVEEEARIVDKKLQVVKVQRFVPGDKWAQQKWLSIRQRALWSEVHQVETRNTQINITKIDLTGIGASDLEALERLGISNKQKQLNEPSDN